MLTIGIRGNKQGRYLDPSRRDKGKKGWSDKKKIALGVVVLILVIVIAAVVIDPPNEEKEVVTAPPIEENEGVTTSSNDVAVEHEVITKFGSVYLRVHVTGPEKAYSIQLTGPDKQTVGESYISKDDMADGTEATDVSMTELLAERKTPKSGQYTLLVREFFSNEKVFEATPTYEGPDVDIDSVGFETSYYDIFDSGDIDKVTLTLSNTGDLPILIDRLIVVINEEESEEPLFDESLPTGKKTEVDVTTFITDLDKGVHPVTLEVYSGDSKLSSYDTEVEIG